LPEIESVTELNFMPISNYSMIFRVLFGSTYLTRAYSEKALEVLTRTQYKDGIVSGVPKDMLVAHKFGVKKVLETGTLGSAELHDCGVVYYPNHPYLLCVMTRGKDFAELQSTIGEISKTAYKALDAYYGSLPSAAPVLPK